MKITSQKALAAWLDTLTESYSVIAPQQVDSVIMYRPIAASTDVVFDFERTALSAKSFFLPDTEIILEMVQSDNRVSLTEPSLDADQILFGLRPCDARALSVLDNLLLDDAPADTYYAQRRDNTTLVGLACPRLWNDCFCTSLGSAPDDASAMDVMLYGTADQYLVQVRTDRGAALVDMLEASNTDQPAPAPRLPSRQVPVLDPELWADLFDDVYWQRLADRCLSCHACTYVCPTCRCFDIRDRTVAADAGYAHIERLRAWDSCLSSSYRRIAGGHNPRSFKAQRLRNRYYCKFHVSPEHFGTVACVGCGRCIAACPVHIDIAEVLTDVAHLAERESP
jgi:ferredoxin